MRSANAGTVTPRKTCVLNKSCGRWGVRPRDGCLGYNTPQGPPKNYLEHFSPAGSPGAGLSTFQAPQGSVIGPHPEQLQIVFSDSLSCALSGLRRRFWPKRGLQGRSFPWKIWYFLLFEWPAESGRATSSGAADLLVEINFVTDLLAETACNGSNGPVSAKLAVRQNRSMRLASLHSAGPPRAPQCTDSAATFT